MGPSLCASAVRVISCPSLVKSLLNLDDQGHVAGEVGIILVKNAAGMRNQGEVLSAVWAERSLPVSSPGLPAAGKGKRNGGCEQKMRKVFHESTLGSGIAAVNPLFWGANPSARSDLPNE